MNAGDWVWSDEYREAGRVVDVEALWGEHFYRLWLPSRAVVVRVPAAGVRPVAAAAAGIGASHIAYTVAAARVAEALTRNVLLAPIESSVIPLPHQLQALSRALATNPVRLLLADEVGLGKTIEAGLILRELKLRGLVRRALVVAPKGLVTQWVAELRTHFGEEFQLLDPAGAASYKRVARDGNLWRLHDQVVCAMDAVKPLDARRGWSPEQVDAYNRDRFEDLIAAGWDLVIVDEAHRLGGSADTVARYRLGQGLAGAAPYLLLLSATPHQGKTDAFHRIVALLDPTAFPDVASVNRERIRPYVIRTEKRRAIDARGHPLFKPRHTRLVPVAWEERHREQQLLYEAVTDYVREGYNRALSEKRSYVGFLMILMQRLVTSSTRAIRHTLERRLDALQGPEEQAAAEPTLPDDEWADLDGQEQVDLLVGSGLAALRNERAEVALLLDAARRTEARGPDAKAEALLEWIYQLQREETAPELKVLIFTEFVPTQQMLRDFLTERGFAVVTLNGSMDLNGRARVQHAFATEARVLVSTDAGGEGLNLQFCHVVVNYDIPWNPMRLEQRIGRVDRIGQERPVRALNFVYEDTVEYRVREVLEEKLAVILEQFGVDKTGDVLDAAQAGTIFDEVYVESILDPETIDATVAGAVDRVREQVKAVSESRTLLDTGDALDADEARRAMEHPLPHWIERMTRAYLDTAGGASEKRGDTWTLTWPSGEATAHVVFDAREATADPSVTRLTLEDARVRDMVTRLPLFAEGQAIPSLIFLELPSSVEGFWSLWQVSLDTAEGTRRRIMPLFLHDDGRVFVPAARRIWEQLLSEELVVCDHVSDGAALDAFARVRRAAEAQGQPLYQELVQAYQDELTREREKREYAFEVRRRIVQRLGLPEVRAHRLAQLAREEQDWREAGAARAGAPPELTPLLIVRVSGGA